MKNQFTSSPLPTRFRSLLLPALLLGGLTAQSQTTWNGATNTEWDNAGNWSAGVPDAADDVTIPNVTNDPIISTAAVAGSFRINGGGLLTINEGASLATTPVTSQNFVDGTLVNYGTFTVTAGTNIQDCLYNTGSVLNKPTGLLRLNGAFGNGIWNVTDGSNVTNEGTIIIGDAILTGSSGILNSGTLINAATGTLQIDRSRGNALVNVKIVTNAGLIRIGVTAPPAGRGIVNLRTNPTNPVPVFTNLACGVIEVFALVVNQDGDFINNGLLMVNTSRLYGKTVVRVNSPGGVARAYDFTPAAFGGNTAGVNLTADAVFVEDGTAPATDGCQPLTNAAQLAGKIALIDRGTCEFGFKCLQAQQAGAIAVIVFNNVAGSVLMGPGAVGNQVTIPCVSLSQADGQAIRAALANSPVNIGFVQEFESIVPLTNNGIIDYPQGNPIPLVTNNDLIVAPVSGCDPTVSPALQIGGGNSFTVANTWYKDPALTQVAGTYNPNTNTFTATNLAAGSTVPLYFSATDNVNNCARTVSITVTIKALPTVSITGLASSFCKNATAVPLAGSPSGGTFTIDNQPATQFDPASLSPGTHTVVYSYTDPSTTCSASATQSVSIIAPVFTQQPSLPANLVVCAGQSVSISFNVNCAVNASFSAELSNSSGSFTSGTQSLGPVSPGVPNTLTIPGLTPSANYRIRVVGVNPTLYSLPTGSFKINAIEFNSTPTVSLTAVCAGEAIKVSFTVSGNCPFLPGNAFSVELSDASGSFASPVALGTVSPGINTVSIPQTIPTGSAYRVRIRATAPDLLSAQSAAFPVNQPGFASTPSVSLDNKCAGEAVRLSFSVGCAFFAGNTFTAQLSNAAGSFASPVNVGTVTPGALNNVVIPAGTPAGTSYKIRVVSSNPVLTSAVSANFKVKACGNNREIAPEEEGLQVRVSPNPSPEGRLRITVTGAEGQALRVELFNGTGQTLREKHLLKAGQEEVVDWDVARQPAGLYLLRVSGEREAKTLKVLH